MANQKYLELQMRLGIIRDEKKEETTDDILERLRKEQKNKEEKALQKVVEP